MRRAWPWIVLLGAIVAIGLLARGGDDTGEPLDPRSTGPLGARALVLLLEELGSQPFEMPSYMFRFKKLRSLFLGNCTLRIPSTFGSFSTLFELSLRDVSINDDDLHHLLLRCPLLVK